MLKPRPAIVIALGLFIPAAILSVFFLSKPDGKLSGEITDTGYVKAIGNGTDYNGVELSLLTMELNSDPKIMTVTWHNGSNDSITYGEVYHIYKSEDGEWISCADTKKNENGIAFNDIAYFLAPGTTNVHTYRNDGFDLSRTGTYRIQAVFFLNKDVPVTEEDHLTVWLDFIITEKSPEAAQ